MGAPARQRLAGLGGTFLALAGLTYLLAVGTSHGQLVDEAMKGFWLPLRDDVSGLGHDLFRLLGWPLLVAGAVLVLATCLARRDLVLGVTAGALLLGGPAVVWLAQRGLQRPMLGGETFPHSNTLPSGHASVAAAVALVLLLLARPSQQRLALASALVVAVVGVAVPAAAAAHRPSDVAASFLVVGAWAALVLLVAGRGAPAWRDAGPARGCVALAGIAVALVALAVLGAAALRAPDHVPETTNIVWLAGLALVAAVAVVVVAALAPSLLARVASNEGAPHPLVRPSARPSGAATGPEQAAGYWRSNSSTSTRPLKRRDSASLKPAGSCFSISSTWPVLTWSRPTTIHSRSALAAASAELLRR